MKVLLICSEPVDYAIAYANGLAPHATVKAVFARQRFGGLVDAFDRRVDLDLVEWPRHRSLMNLGLLARLSRKIKSFRPDVVHVLSNTTLWLNAAVPFWREVPVVTTVHDVAVHPGDRDTARLPGWSARLMARLSDHLIVHGPGLRLAAMRSFGKGGDRVHVLSHPSIRRYADLAGSLDLQRQQPSENFVALMFGRLYGYKGLPNLIRAESLLGDRIPNLKVVIAGPGDDPNALSGLMGRPERYHIRTGHVPDRDTAQLFVDADVVVLPYDEASQSGVLNIAVAFGKPLVVTDVGELRATVEPNRIGLVVPPKSPQDLADALATLAGDPDLLRRLSRNARAWAEGANAPNTIGAAAASLYRGIAGLGPDSKAEEAGDLGETVPLGRPRRPARIDAPQQGREAGT